MWACLLNVTFVVRSCRLALLCLRSRGMKPAFGEKTRSHSWRSHEIPEWCATHRVHWVFRARLFGSKSPNLDSAPQSYDHELTV